MKKLFIIILIIIGFLKVEAQEEGVPLDLLKASSSPAATILGFSVSDIEKPTDISSLMLSLQSATNSFSVLPSNYAVDFAPFFLLKKGRFNTMDLNKKNFKDVFKQTFVVSFGLRNLDSTFDNFRVENSYTALGIKFSICRPGYIPEDTLRLHNISAKADIVNNFNAHRSKEFIKLQTPELIKLRKRLDEIIETTTEIELDSAEVQQRLTFLADEFRKDSANYKATLLQQIEREAAGFTATRRGLFIDIAVAAGNEFVNRRFDNSRLFNAGIWSNFGYTARGFNALFLLRYLYNPDRIFARDNLPNQMANISTFDAGFRALHATEGSRFTASLEAIYRSVLSSETIDPSWRIVFNADYAIFKNQKLSFSFGRNFDGSLSKDGNLIAALTFLAGFGNKR